MRPTTANRKISALSKKRNPSPRLLGRSSHPAEVLPYSSLAQSLGSGQEVANLLSGIRHQSVLDQVRDTIPGVHVELVDAPLHGFLQKEDTTQREEA